MRAVHPLLLLPAPSFRKCAKTQNCKTTPLSCHKGVAISPTPLHPPVRCLFLRPPFGSLPNMRKVQKSSISFSMKLKTKHLRLQSGAACYDMGPSLDIIDTRYVPYQVKCIQISLYLQFRMTFCYSSSNIWLNAEGKM